MEEIGVAIIATIVAVVVTLIGDLGFDQHWNFFIVWLICLVSAFGGFLIIDSDGDWDIW